MGITCIKTTNNDNHPLPVSFGTYLVYLAKKMPSKMDLLQWEKVKNTEGKFQNDRY